MSVAHVRRLQRSVGNRAATKAVGRPAVQRLESPPETVTRPTAEADPRFASVEADVRGKQKQVAAHPPAASEASAAQAAAVAPQDDKLAQGKAANAEKMNAAKPGEFDKAGFVRAVEQAIAAQAPKNLDEADDFAGSGKADAVKGQVQGQVTAGKQASAGPIESTTNAPPDTAAATEKPVTPLAPDRPPGAPAAPDAAKAVPEKAPAAATDFSAGPKQVDGDMAAAGVTEEQLAKSNEPEFTGALQEKKEVEQHAATAPGKVRGAEAETLGEARAAAAGTGAAAMAGLAGERAKAGGKVTADKQGAKGKDEARRAQVTATLQKVFDATKTDVEAILSGLDKKVDDAFTTGEKAARDAFTAEHKQKMDAYKDRRYSGFTGKLKWVKDKFAGLPEEANQIFVTARQGYVTRMRAVISSVADVIGGELTRAKTRIASGREQLQAEVRKLPADLQAVGKQAAGELAGKFDELTESVDAKGSELVQTLASKYNEALKSVDAEIDAEKEKNKGLVAKAVGAIKGVIDTILKLKDLLLGILAKAAAAVLGILKDPIGFLGNLVSAVGSGLRAFMANIGEHLKKGLIGWLLGAMAGAGVQLPAKFDLRGIIMMIGSLLGLTWSAIRGRVLSRGVPEPAMAAAEGAVPVARKLKSEGVGGIWETIKAKTGDLKAGLFGKIAQFLVPTVLIAGITWIISLLNPASAFVKAVKMIIDIVTFIVTQGAQILQFVNAVLDAVIAIAGGGAGGVPTLIEAALATSIPVLIGALAAILGISGIADKVKKIIQSLSKPVMKVIDWVVDKIAGIAKKLWAKLKSKVGGKDKGKRGEPGADGAKKGKDPRIRELVAADVAAALPDGVADEKVQPALRSIMAKRGPQGLDMLEVKRGDAPGRFDVSMAASPVTRIRTTKVDPGNATARQLLDPGNNPYAEFGFAIPRNVVLSGSFKLPVVGRPGGFGETNALGELHTQSRVTSYEKKVSKDEHTHAEDLLIGEVKSTWDAHVGTPAEQTRAGEARPRGVLEVKVTRTPCPRCAGRLGELRVWASSVKGWDLGVEVRSLGLYHGKTEVTDAVGTTRTLRGVTSGKEGLLRLRQWGIAVTPMPATDPAIQRGLAALDPADQIAMIDKIDAYNTKLDAAIAEINLVPVTLRRI
ncbi:phage tail protein [Actinokineospora terrae]|nr:hypothetical protein [Actinokineospora terrae]